VGQSPSFNWLQGWPPCDTDCEKNSKMIRNHAELSVRINK
jgi:hypothetical protein